MLVQVFTGEKAVHAVESSVLATMAGAKTAKKKKKEKKKKKKNKKKKICISSEMNSYASA